MANLNSIGGLHYEMMRRCYNPKSIAFKSYGAKGIKVCNEWHNRDNFRKWCNENGYTRGLRIQRIDSNLDYTPQNCILSKKNTLDSGKNTATRRVKKHRQNIKEKYNVPKKYSDLRLYRIFVSMHSRCEIKSNTHYYNYGGRGITVCEEWSGKDGFFVFYNWAMGNGYNDKLTIDRLNNNMGYSPDNCRWATINQQMRNRRNSKNFIYKDKLVNLKDVATENKTTYGRLYNRVIQKGMTIEEALDDIKKNDK